ncbi:MAG: LysE family translocator [Chloroflexota bacterium]
MDKLLLSAVGLGLVFSATPGAVNTESLRRGASQGFWPALLVQLGSLTGDVMWAGIALTGTAFLVQNRTITLLLGIVGACFLLRQAFFAFRGAATGGMTEVASPPSRGDFITGSFFSLTNPFAVAFWLGLGASVTATAHAGLANTAVFFVGFFLGAVLWCMTFSWAVSLGRRYLNARLLRAIDAISGVVLGYFGLRLLWQSLRALRVLRLVRVVSG